MRPLLALGALLVIVACAPDAAEHAAPAQAPPTPATAGPPANFSIPATNWQPEIGPAKSSALLPRQPCAHRDPLRQALYGDLHVHTGFSMDVSEREGFSNPDTAYRFARGEAVDLPGPSASSPHRRAQLERPLDFAAVTDHSEWLGEVSLCTHRESPAYDSEGCRVFRGEQAPPSWMPARMAGILGRDGHRP